MRDDKRYNGWKNYETWCISLWINNEEPMYKHWRARACELRDEYEHKQGSARGALAKELLDDFEQDKPEVEGFWGDLLTSAFQEVDWYEVAESLLEDVS